jgi:hypothetical protein
MNEELVVPSLISLNQLVEESVVADGRAHSSSPTMRNCWG